MSLVSLGEGRNKALRRMLGNSIVQDDPSAKGEKRKADRSVELYYKTRGFAV